MKKFNHAAEPIVDLNTTRYFVQAYVSSIQPVARIKTCCCRDSNSLGTPIPNLLQGRSHNHHYHCHCHHHQYHYHEYYHCHYYHYHATANRHHYSPPLLLLPLPLPLLLPLLLLLLLPTLLSSRAVSCPISGHFLQNCNI